MLERMIKFFKSLENLDLYRLRYDDALISKWAATALSGVENPTVIDLGYGEGRDLRLVKKVVASKKQSDLIGVDYFEKKEDYCRTVRCNIEEEPLPFAPQSADLIICNQILEHCKEIFWIKDQISKTLKHGAYVIIGVPNLAGWQERFSLLIGDQPSEIRPIYCHIRGFTKKGMIHFMEYGGHFKTVDFGSAGFRPLINQFYCTTMAKLFPTLAMNIYLLFERTDVDKTIEYPKFNTNFRR